MNIKEKCRIAGLSAIALVLFCGIVAGFEIDTIRIGGPIARQNQEISDLDADILPPPAYIIEPFLDATLLARDPASLPRGQASLARAEQAFRASVARWKASSLSEPAIRQPLDRAVQDAELFWDELDHVMLPAVRRGDTAATQASYARLAALYATHRQHIDQLVVATAKVQQALAEHGQRQLARTVALLVAIGLILVALTAAALAYLLRRVLRPIGDTADAMRRMADGDLTLSLTGGERTDEIGTMVAAVEVFREAAQAQVANARKQETVVHELTKALGDLGDGDLSYRIGDALPDEYGTLARSFDAAMERLSQTLGRVAESATRVKVATVELRSASDDLSQRTEQQAAALEQTAAAVHEITSAVSEAANGANRTDTIVRGVRRETEESGAIVRRAVEAMGAIERSSNEISEIISVIDGIAFQTNLLALNAGVEAARAGDAGRGFAVVASEVRALAQRSADAARDVKGRILASGALVQDGVGLVTDTGRTLDSIFVRIGEVSDLVSGIARSSEQQARGLSQVNVAVGEMDGMTQQNAAMVEQATAAARELAGEADALAQDVDGFKLGATPSSPGPVRDARASQLALVHPGTDNPSLAAS
ncbi:methyl-accepting chemotaxis protein [Sphingomonas sp. M6A6_1c]